MAIRNILNVKKLEDQKILTKNCSEVIVKELGSHKIRQIIQDLKDTALAHIENCAGLAAPQIGYNKRIILINEFKEDLETKKPILQKTLILINPKLKVVSKKTNIWWEGCLSVPNTWGLVKRYNKVTVEALNEEGAHVKLKVEIDKARLLQHEIDHLDGVLFTSKVHSKLLSEKELDLRLESSTKSS